MACRIIAFDIWGDLAHFRRFFTTSSPLTFSFPPPTTVRGIIGAILGLQKNEYIEITNRLSIGIYITSPIRKLRTGLNIIFTKRNDGKFEPTLFKDKKGNDKKNVRTRIQVEFLKDPGYRIFVAGDEKLLDSLLNYLPYHKTEYTVSLGLSECLADFKFTGEFTAEEVEETSEIHSVIPTRKIKNISLSNQIKLAKERIPIYMNAERIVQEYDNIVFETSGKPIKGAFKNVFHIKETGENIHLFTVPSQQMSKRSFEKDAKSG
ncbi:type I-B CRISPR-associated protein Cas5b [Desulfurobacterium sp.]